MADQTIQQQWEMVDGIRVFACDCIPNGPTGEIATYRESMGGDAFHCERSVVLLEDHAAALERAHAARDAVERKLSAARGEADFHATRAEQAEAKFTTALRERDEARAEAARYQGDHAKTRTP